MNEDQEHFDFETLADLVAGVLDDKQVHAAEKHLAACRSCSRARSRLVKVIGVMRTDRLEEVPELIVSRAAGLSRERYAESAKESIVHRIAAVLIPDRLFLRPAFGLRTSAEIQKISVYRAGEDEIVLGISDLAGSFRISGQHNGAPAGGRATLTGENAAVDASISDLGEFSFATVASGRYELLLSYPDAEIDIGRVIVE